ncbi:unnamed protein product [Trichogramma brassicae]|uniref:Uncharacterized protein n=1 Tax=Trichogramma brassicae TaxID=86971 RepID=A0A6H5IHP2_9HYME|nr:unnamed protein product [Trichogramma brassicae]
MRPNGVRTEPETQMKILCRIALHGAQIESEREMGIHGAAMRRVNTRSNPTGRADSQVLTRVGKIQHTCYIERVRACVPVCTTMSAFDLPKADNLKGSENVPASKTPAPDVSSSQHLHPMTLHRDTVRRIFADNPKIDVNRVDPESGVTLFHVACEYGFADVVEQLIARHRAAPEEFDCRPVEARDELGNAPLHLAMRHDHPDNQRVAELLLRAGADPDAANDEGSTVLHLICKRENFIEAQKLARTFFKICKDARGGRVPRVTIRDKRGRTPLEWAAANRAPTLLDELLDQSGAGLSGFVFPYPSYYDAYLKPKEHETADEFESRTRFDSYGILDCLRKRGWVTKEADPAKILPLIRRYGLEDYATPKFEKFKRSYAYSGPR